MDYTKFLPLEITIDVLTRLPIESVLDYKLVCKTWRNAVRHPTFFNIHLDRLNRASTDSGMLSFIALTNLENYKFQYFEYNENHNHIQRITRFKFTPPSREFNLLGSFNGLICYLDYYYPCSVCICNPITREYVVIPEFRTDCDVVHEYVNWECGFGYVSSTNEYKIVGIDIPDTKFVEVCVYTLRSGNGWRKLGRFNLETSKKWDQCSFANGVLYWLDRKLDMIINFDLAEEKFHENLSPPSLPPDNGSIEIGVLDGCLYFAVSVDVPRGPDYFDIWLLKKKSVNCEMKEPEGHQSMVWNKEFRSGRSKLFAVTNTGGVLTYGFNDLNIYDRKTSTLRTLVKFNDWPLQISPHQNSFLSLKELGEEGTQTMETVEVEETRSRDYSFVQAPGRYEP